MNAIRLLVVEEAGDVSEMLAALAALQGVTKTVAWRPPVVERVLERFIEADHWDAVIIDHRDRKVVEKITQAIKKVVSDQMVVTICREAPTRAWHMRGKHAAVEMVRSAVVI